MIDGLIHFVQRHRGGCGDVHQHACRTLNIKFEKRRQDCEFRGGSGTVLTAGTSDSHQCGASLFHDAPHIREVEIDDPRNGDHVAHPLDSLAEDVVSNSEGVFH